MVVKVGYLLPTREGVMEGRHAARPVIDLAVLAEQTGLDSVWLGDSVTVKPRHDPLTMLAAIAARTERIELGTAVLLPILRNPVILAQQLATLDQISTGRLIVGVGIGQDIPTVRAEFAAVGVPFEKRLGRMMEGVRLWKALWSGEPVTHDGRWQLDACTIGPIPHTPSGPPIWGCGNVPAALERCAKHFDGWFPAGPSQSDVWTSRWRELQGYAAKVGRSDGRITGAAYLTMSLDQDGGAADAALNSYLERYYNMPAARIRQYQGCYAGGIDGALTWLRGYVEGGVSHLCLRVIGDHERNIAAVGEIRAALNS